MSMSRFFIAVCGLMWCALAMVGPAGCKKQPYLPTVEQTPYLGLPANLDKLANINVRDLRALDDVRNVIRAIETTPQINPLMTILRTRVQFDPWQDLDQVVIGWRGQASPQQPFKNMVIICSGRFAHPEAKLDDLREYLGEEYLIQPPPFIESLHPNTTFRRFSTRAQSQYNEAMVFDLNFGFPSETLMVFSFSPQLVGDALDVIAGAAFGLGQDPFWQQMLNRVNLGTTFWGAGNIAGDTLAAMRESPMADASLGYARQFYYFIKIIQDFRLELGLVCETIDNAVALSESLKRGLAMIKPFAEQMAAAAPNLAALPGRIVIMAELGTVKISLPLSDTQMKAVLREVRDLAGKIDQMPLPGAPALPGGDTMRPSGPLPGQP